MSDPLLSPRPQSRLAGIVGPAAILLMLAAWLVASPLVFEYRDHARATSDQLSAAVIAVAAFAALLSRREWPLWIAGAVGVWLVLAPAILQVDRGVADVTGLATGLLVLAEGLLYPIGRRRRARGRPPRATAS